VSIRMDTCTFETAVSQEGHESSSANLTSCFAVKDIIIRGGENIVSQSLAC